MKSVFVSGHQATEGLNMQIRIFLAIGSVFSIALIGCSPSIPFIGNDEDEVLTLLYWQAPTIPNAYLSAGSKDIDAAAITLEPLARYDPDGAIIPILAADVPSINNGGISGDLLSITWTLKEGLKWSDGSDMTADDVVFTWLYCTDPDTGCTSESAFDGINSVQAVDDLIVKITFDVPTPYPYNAFVGSSTPVISRLQFGECLNPDNSCDSQINSPLGTGPYRIVSFTTNEEVVYERNPHYRGDEPYFDRVVLKGGGDAITAAETVLANGNADYAWNLQIEPEELASLQLKGYGTVVSAFSSLVERIVLNQTNPDPSLGVDRSEYLDGQNPHPFLIYRPIQSAMSMAINRELISERLYGFAGQPTCNLITGPPNYVSTANDNCLDQDIEAAKKLLDENDVLDSDGDSIREFNGIPLSVVFQTSTNDVRQQTQEMIEEWWSQIGIDVQIIHHDAGLFFGGDPVDDAQYTYRRFFADVQMYANGPAIDPQNHLSDLICKHIPTRDDNWSLGNISRGCNPSYDELFDELTETPIGANRAELVKQLNDIYVNSYFEIPLVNRGLVSAHSNTLKGVKMNAWDSELWNIAEWYR